MRSWLIHAAALATLSLPLATGEAVAAHSGRQAPPVRAHAVIDRLLEHRDTLVLESTQVVELTRLAERLRTHPTRLRIVGQRVPGKASLRVRRESISREEALRSALRVLSPAQRSIAVRIVASDTMRTALR